MTSLTFGLGALQGKTMDFVDVSESNARWVQDFRLKAYASPAKLESIDGEGPRPWRVGRVGFQVGLWPHSAPSLCSWSSQGLPPGAVTVYGRPLLRLGPRVPSCLCGERCRHVEMGRQEWSMGCGSLGRGRDRDKGWCLTAGARGLTGLWSPQVPGTMPS